MDRAERRLIRKCQQGDQALYSQLVDRYTPLIWKVTYHFARDNEEAEDLTQEAFLHLFRNLTKFRFRSAFSTWLYRVVWNFCLNHVRRSRKHRLEVSLTEGDDDAGPRELRDTGRVPDQVFEEKEREGILLEAVRSLDPRYRAVVVLYYFHHIPYREIAKVLGVPIGTVKTYLFRGKEALRLNLAETLGETHERQLC